MRNYQIQTELNDLDKDSSKYETFLVSSENEETLKKSIIEYASKLFDGVDAYHDEIIAIVEPNGFDKSRGFSMHLLCSYYQVIYILVGYKEASDEFIQNKLYLKFKEI